MGWFGVDCENSSYAWADPGCVVIGIGKSVGSGVDAAIKPITSEVNTILWTVAILIVIVLALIAFSPNVKHIVPHFV